MKNTYTYRFEIRGGNCPPEFTDDPDRAMQHALNRSEITCQVIYVVDNDNPCPLARVYHGFAEMLQKMK